MRSHLAAESRFRGLLLATATPSAIPPLDLDSLDETGKFWISTKLAQFPDGFTAHPIGLAIRGVFGASFTPDLIPRLLDFENAFDRALVSTEGKFDLFQNRFVYNLGYKETLWKTWHKKLDDDPVNLLKLCLLCPPDFFLASIDTLIGFFPVFLKSDIKGSLDLLIFSLMSLEKRSLIAFLKVMGDVVESLIRALQSDCGPVRMDVCRVFHIMGGNVPGTSCQRHKSRVVRALRSVLDDPKREVRKMAAIARCAWMAINANDDAS
jgi:hypothetical protein